MWLILIVMGIIIAPCIGALAYDAFRRGDLKDTGLGLSLATLMVIWTGVWFVVAMSNFIASQLPEWAFLLLFWFGVFLGFASISIALEMRWQNWANSETPKLIIAKRIWNWVGSSLKLFTCVFAGAEAKSLVHHIPSESVAKIIQTHSPLSVWWSEKFTGLVIFFAFMAVLIVILKSQLFVISKSHYKRFGEH